MTDWEWTISIATGRVIVLLGLLTASFLYLVKPKHDVLLASSAWEQVLRALVVLLAAIMLASQVLTLVSLLQAPSLIVLLGGLWGMVVWLRFGSQLRQDYNDWIRSLGERLDRGRLLAIDAPRPPAVRPDLAAWLVALLTGWAVLLYFIPVLTSPAPPTADALTNLLWVKQLYLNRPLAGGVFPRGLHELLASMSLLGAQDPYLVMRVIGPLFNGLALVAAAFVLGQWTGKPTAAAVMVLLAGLGQHLLPLPWERLAATLPDQFAMAVFWPTLWWFRGWLRSGESYFLWLTSAGWFVVGSSSWPVLAWLLISCGVLAGWQRLRRGIERSEKDLAGRYSPLAQGETAGVDGGMVADLDLAAASEVANREGAAFARQGGVTGERFRSFGRRWLTVLEDRPWWLLAAALVCSQLFLLVGLLTGNPLFHPGSGQLLGLRDTIGWQALLPPLTVTSAAVALAALLSLAWLVWLTRTMGGSRPGLEQEASSELSWRRRRFSRLAKAIVQLPALELVFLQLVAMGVTSLLVVSGWWSGFVASGIMFLAWMSAAAAAVLWAVLVSVLPRGLAGQRLALAGVVLAVIMLAIASRPSLPQPRSVLSDSLVSQYLRIEKQWPRMGWAIVSSRQELYPLVLNRGLLNSFDNQTGLPTVPASQSIAEVLAPAGTPVHDLPVTFLFLEHPAHVMEGSGDVYRQQVESSAAAFTSWAQGYLQDHPGYTVIFNDASLTVYQLDTPTGGQ